MNGIRYMIGMLAGGLVVIALAWAASAAVAEGVPKDSEEKPAYDVTRATTKPALDGAWRGPAWKDVPHLEVSHFYRKDLSSHRPETRAKVVYDNDGIYIHFKVEDKYVRSIETKYHGKVWEDACVEFFVQPRPERGYFNFEINCGGTLLLSYKEDPDWTGETRKPSGALSWELAKEVEIFHIMPETVEPEMEGPVTWQVEYFIPFKIFEAYLGDLGDVAGQTWRANFYKCAENNSQPHWASWSLITGGLNFHQPEYFSDIHFTK